MTQPVPPGIREIDPDAEAARLAEARKADGSGWLGQVERRWYASGDTPDAERFVELVHAPTGVRASGRTETEAVADLATKLVTTGEISINAARAATGLAPWGSGVIAAGWPASPGPRDGESSPAGDAASPGDRDAP